MLIEFGFLKFKLSNGKIGLLGVDGAGAETEYRGFAEGCVAGEDKPYHYGTKKICSTESERLEYVRHELTGERLLIVQESSLVRVETVFERFSDANAVRVATS